MLRSGALGDAWGTLRGPRTRQASPRSGPAPPGRLRAQGGLGGPSRPLMESDGLGRGLQPAQERQALVLEPLFRRLEAEPERGPAGLEAHRRAEERRLLACRLDQMEFGARMLDAQGRQAQLQEVLAVDAAGLLHDRVKAPVAQRHDTAVRV